MSVGPSALVGRSVLGDGEDVARFMRYSACEKLEIIELVEQSTVSIGRTLTSIGIPRSTFYDWYSPYQDDGIEALEASKPRPGRVWNKIPDEIGRPTTELRVD